MRKSLSLLGLGILVLFLISAIQVGATTKGPIIGGVEEAVILLKFLVMTQDTFTI